MCEYVIVYVQACVDGMRVERDSLKQKKPSRLPPGLLNKFNFTPEQSKKIVYFDVSELPAPDSADDSLDDKSKASADLVHDTTDTASPAAAAAAVESNPSSEPPSKPSSVSPSVDTASTKQQPDAKAPEAEGVASAVSTDITQRLRGASSCVNTSPTRNTTVSCT